MPSPYYYAKRADMPIEDTTREEEIQLASINFIKHAFTNEKPLRQACFIAGAEWADKDNFELTTKACKEAFNNGYQTAITKVCDWLQKHHIDYTDWDTIDCCLDFDTQKLVDDLKEYMNK